MTDTPDLPGFKPKDLPDLTGTKAVVTGANSGIGFHTAAALADHGAEVVLACRNTEAAPRGSQEDQGLSTVEELDLASQTSIHAFVDRFDGSLDLLVNNAGVMTPPKYRETPEGHELQFGTNHLGHFALTGLLLPALLKSEAPRVVTVASIAHHRGDESVLEGNPETSYDPQQGPTATASWPTCSSPASCTAAPRRPARSSSRPPRTPASRPPTWSDRPTAWAPTRSSAMTAPFFMPVIFQSSAAGANPTLWAATYGEPGSYVGPQWLMESRGRLGEAKLSRHARNDDLARKLWDLSEAKTGVRFDF